MSLYSSAPKIFALKLESCRKSHRVLNVFVLPNFKGGAVPQKVVVALTLQPRGASSAKVSSGYTPNSEVIGAFGGYNSTSRSPRLIDRTSPNFVFARNRCRKHFYSISNIFICFGDIRRRTSTSSEIGLNFACF